MAKRTNDYSRAFGYLYEQVPKAVFAAVAYSFCSSGGDVDTEDAIDKFLGEWATLYANGLNVPRPPAPPSVARPSGVQA